MRPLLDEGLATISTAGSLRGGRDVWMLVEFDREQVRERLVSDASSPSASVMIDAEMEALFCEAAPYGLLTNNHAGKQKVRMRETVVRVVCANTLETSLSGDGLVVSVTHSAAVADNVRAAADRLFGGMVQRFAAFASDRRGLRGLELSDLQHRRLVLDPVVPILHLERKVQRKEATGATTHALERAHARRDEIRRLWTHGVGHVGDRSAWEAYNGLVQALDHDALFAPRKTGASRLLSLYDGDMAHSKRRVLAGLLHETESTPGGC